MKYIEYGKTPSDKNVWPEFYCAVCHKIPVIDIWHKDGTLHQAIDDLYPIPVYKLVQGHGMQEVQMMTCSECVEKIDKRMKDQLKKHLGLGGEGPFDGDGGAPVKR